METPKYQNVLKTSGFWKFLIVAQCMSCGNQSLQNAQNYQNCELNFSLHSHPTQNHGGKSQKAGRNQGSTYNTGAKNYT